MIAACKVAGFDLVIVETSGIGQGDAAIVPLVDVSLYVMTPEFGAATPAREDRHARLRRLRRDQQVRPQGRAGRAARRAQAVPAQPRGCSQTPPDEMPVFGTIASRFNDDGVTALYQAIAADARRQGARSSRTGKLPPVDDASSRSAQHAIVPPARVRYLAEIADTVRGYHACGRGAGAASRASGSSCDGDDARCCERGGRATPDARRARSPIATRKLDAAREEAARHVAEDEGRLRAATSTS